MGLIMNGNDWISSTTNYNRASSDHTVMYWLRVDSTSGTRRPFGSSGAWEARAAGTTLTSDYLQSGTLNTVTLTTGVVHHVTFVQDVTGGNRFGYLDATLVSSNTSASFAGAQNAILNIGVSAGGAGQGWNGVIDDVRVYDRVMPLDEIQTIYACRGRDGIVDSLALWYPLNEEAAGVTASNVIDRGTTQLNLTSVNNTPIYNYDVGICIDRRAA